MTKNAFSSGFDIACKEESWNIDNTNISIDWFLTLKRGTKCMDSHTPCRNDHGRCPQTKATVKK